MGFESADDSEQVKNKIIFVVFGVDLRIHRVIPYGCPKG